MKAENLSQKWLPKWEEAIRLWSKYLMIRTPKFIKKNNEKNEGVEGSIALIKLDTHEVMICEKQIEDFGLEEFALEIFAHELGHHIFYPGNLTNQGKLLFKIRRGLDFARMGYQAPIIANLYTDLFINQKLKTEFGLRVDEVYQKLNNKSSTSKLWAFYMRVYEIMWGLEKNTLTSFEINEIMEGDAILTSRIIKSYTEDWLKGATKFALIILTYLLEDKTLPDEIKPHLDSLKPGRSNEIPDGLMEMDPEDFEPLIHPALEVDETKSKSKEKANQKSFNQSSGQARQPFEIGQILKDMGIQFDATSITIRYYKERASGYLIPFPRTMVMESKEPLMEGSDVWDVGSPIENINWFQSTVRSPVIIPGYTVLEDVYGLDSGTSPEFEATDLDIYVDCSGSMPNPSVNLSYPALAGTIVAMSALRAGSKVQATLWSGAGQFHKTEGFIRNEAEILKVITGYIGGGTAFPISILRDTYEDGRIHKRNIHILIISDDGVTTILDKDEKGNSGFEIAKKALENCKGGGTMVLQLYSEIHRTKGLNFLNEQGWKLHRVSNWNGLIQFAEKFSKEQYGTKNARRS
ncbi:MAG: VWA domain-containing protein [Leptospiraceae bacterium]|nr:VWA domain-containing protein [Leptospiraceae bacterium]